MRILVAQMTRMGDVLQTSPLIRALKRRHPDAHITLLVRAMGKAIAQANPDVDDVVIYDEDQMFKLLMTDDSDKLIEAYRIADDYGQRLRAGKYDVVYNCTHSLASALFFKLCSVPKVVGADISQDWQYVLRSRGANYFFAGVLHRTYNDLNLCDLFRHFMEDPPPSEGLVFRIDDEARREARDILREQGIADEGKFVCFQLGASDEHKRWPASHFASLGKQLAQNRGLRVVLLGVKKEKALGERFEDHAPNLAVHLFEKTNIPQLAAVLDRAELLVTNDTGTMHIAAAAGCPAVLTSVGYVHFRETGPYGRGHCAIEGKRADLGRSDIMRGAQTGQETISPEQALVAVDLVTRMKDEGGLVQLDDEPGLATVDLHASDFAPDGALEWYPVVRRPITAIDVYRLAYRLMWLAYLQGLERIDKEGESITRFIGSYLPPEGASMAELCSQLDEAVTGLGALAEQGEALSRQLVTILEASQGYREAKGLVEQLMELDERIRLHGEIEKDTRPLVAMFRFERDNLEGADPLVLARDTLRLYEEMNTRVRLTRDKLARIVETSGISM